MWQVFDEVTLPVNVTALRDYDVNIQTLVEDIQARTTLRVTSSGDRLMISGTFSSIQTARNMVLKHIVLASRRQMESAADLVSDNSGKFLNCYLLANNTTFIYFCIQGKDFSIQHH